MREDLIIGVARAESSFNPFAVSRKGRRSAEEENNCYYREEVALRNIKRLYHTLISVLNSPNIAHFNQIRQAVREERTGVVRVGF